MTTKLDLQTLEELKVPEGKWIEFMQRWLPQAREGGMVQVDDRSWED